MKVLRLVIFKNICVIVYYRVVQKNCAS